MTRSLKNNKDLIQPLQLQIKGAYDQLQNLQVASGLIPEQVHVTQGLEATQNRSLNFNQQAKTRQTEAALIQTRPPKARSREQVAFNEVLVDDLNEMLGTQFGSYRELLTGGVKAARSAGPPELELIRTSPASALSAFHPELEAIAGAVNLSDPITVQGS